MSDTAPKNSTPKNNGISFLNKLGLAATACLMSAAAFGGPERVSAILGSLGLNPDPNASAEQYLRKNHLEGVCTDNGGKVVSTANLGQPGVRISQKDGVVASLLFDSPSIPKRVAGVSEGVLNLGEKLLSTKTTNFYQPGGNPNGTTYGNRCQLTNPSPEEIRTVLGAINGKTM